MGADSLLIDAENGTVIKTPPPNALTRYFRQAHFYFFAGSWQVPLLILMAALASASALSGLSLNFELWFGALSPRVLPNALFFLQHRHCFCRRGAVFSLPVH